MQRVDIYKYKNYCRPERCPCLFLNVYGSMPSDKYNKCKNSNRENNTQQGTFKLLI